MFASVLAAGATRPRTGARERAVLLQPKVRNCARVATTWKFLQDCSLKVVAPDADRDDNASPSSDQSVPP